MDQVSRVGIFLEVVKQQSFIAAARKLGMTGPAISKQIQKLEEQLGVKLLQRTTRQITLTEEGAIYNEKARKALEDLHEVEAQIRELKDSPTGILRVNAPMSFGKTHLIEPIASFAQKYPDVKMEVDFDDRNVDIVSEGYDVVIRIGVLQDSSFIARKLANCPLVLCATQQFVEQYGVPKAPDDLIKFPAIIYNKHDNIGKWQYQDLDGNVKMVSFKQKFAANNAEMMLQACLHNIGVAILPFFIVQDYLKSGELVQILPAYHTYPERGIYAIFPQNRYLSTKVRLFVDWLTQCSNNFA